MTTQEMIDDLTTKVATLTQTVTDQQGRESAAKAVAAQKEAAEEAQVTLLTQQVTDLQATIAAGGLTPAQVTALTAVSSGMQAVITSISAADPTPPVTPAP